jgi:hypothetical protein
MKKIITPLLLLSAVFVTPAYANFFSNPALGISMNVGSAPNPTPNDIRENREPVLAGATNPAPAKGPLILSEAHQTHKAAPAAPSR